MTPEEDAAQRIKDGYRLDPLGPAQATYYKSLADLQMTIPGAYNPKPLRPTVDPRLVFEDHVDEVFAELEALLLSKHADYGPTNIALAPGGALNGLRVRIHDKVARINHLLDNDRDPRHEALEDSFRDLANYAAIAILVLRKQWPS